MSKASTQALGKARTTNSEFISLGADAWWMHEWCMSESDRKQYDNAAAGALLQEAPAPPKGTLLAAGQSSSLGLGARFESAATVVDYDNAEAVAEAAVAQPYGWIPQGHKCDLCCKAVADRGGVYCGRRRGDGTVAGCGAAICWRCMSRAPREVFGKIRTTKSEFLSLGAEAWWMHERCMNAADLKDYDGESDTDGLTLPPEAPSLTEHRSLQPCTSGGGTAAAVNDGHIPEGPRADAEVAAKAPAAGLYGWLPQGRKCDICFKAVVDRGGVFCGRHRGDGNVAGCGAALCWRCMNKGSREAIGKLRTTKSEFVSLGADAWWMHERCMSTEDRKHYDGEGNPGNDAEVSEQEFAWEGNAGRDTERSEHELAWK